MLQTRHLDDISAWFCWLEKEAATIDNVGSYQGQADVILNFVLLMMCFMRTTIDFGLQARGKALETYRKIA